MNVERQRGDERSQLDAEKAAAAVEQGKTKFVPELWTKTYMHWTTNIRDWCISRQLWWGHRIPAWYCACGETIVARETPAACPKCRATELKQDEDVLDTWFSSALWCHSTPVELPVFQEQGYLHSHALGCTTDFLY